MSAVIAPSRARVCRPRRAAMALSKLSGDEQGIILGQLCNSLEPRLAVYFGSASVAVRSSLLALLRYTAVRGSSELHACLKMC